MIVIESILDKEIENLYKHLNTSWRVWSQKKPKSKKITHGEWNPVCVSQFSTIAGLFYSVSQDFIFEDKDDDFHTQYSLMREDIEPMWESLPDGIYSIIKLPKNDDVNLTLFYEIILAMVGEYLLEKPVDVDPSTVDYPIWSNVKGVTLTNESTFAVIKFWVDDHTKPITFDILAENLREYIDEYNIEKDFHQKTFKKSEDMVKKYDHKFKKNYSNRSDNHAVFKLKSLN